MIGLVELLDVREEEVKITKDNGLISVLRSRMLPFTSIVKTGRGVCLKRNMMN